MALFHITLRNVKNPAVSKTLEISAPSRDQVAATSMVSLKAPAMKTGDCR